MKDKADADNAMLMKAICEKLIGVLGGTVSGNKMLCKYVVYFKGTLPKDHKEPNKKQVHFKYLTESFFSWLRLPE